MQKKPEKATGHLPDLFGWMDGGAGKRHRKITDVAKSYKEWDDLESHGRRHAELILHITEIAIVSLLFLYISKSVCKVSILILE